jgi:uncharacterized OB-fold protein
MAYDKPLPIITALNEPFWSALKAREIRFQRCSDCHCWIYPIAPMCQSCWSDRYEWAPVSGEVSLSSWVTYHKAFHPSFERDLPYIVMEVQFAEGMRMLSRLPDEYSGPATLTIGQTLTPWFDDVTKSVTLLKFIPAESED